MYTKVSESEHKSQKERDVTKSHWEDKRIPDLPARVELYQSTGNKPLHIKRTHLHMQLQAQKTSSHFVNVNEV